MTDREFILAPEMATVQVSVALEPAFNIINSLALMGDPEARSGFSEWVTRTATSLAPDVRRAHQILFKSGVFHAFAPIRSYPDFPAYLDDLAGQDPVEMRDRGIDMLCQEHYADVQPPDRDMLLGDKGEYLAYLARLYVRKMSEKERAPDIELLSATHDLLNDPPAMKHLILSHLGAMWDTVMEPEWRRSLPMLQESVEAFQQLDYSHLTALEAARLVTGRDLTGIVETWGRRVVFIPSAHIGPYVSWSEEPNQSTTWMVFGARLPEGARVRSPALSRSELLVRISALADDTRLQILELLTKHQELCAQDVIEMLSLSQSAASRHLRQLTATGFLIERRREVAKCYSLNPQRVDDTLRAVRQFMRAR